jgi:hypothetical protein
MSTTQEVEGIVTLPFSDPPAEETAETSAVQPVEAPVAKAARPRPAWIVPAAIGAIGLIVAGALGFVLYTTIRQRDTLRTQLVSTKGTLVATQAQLTAAQQDAAEKKVTADYVAMYVVDNGRVQTDYQNTIVCTSYTQCRTAAQQLNTDLQAFQADRKSAKVPFALENQDSDLGTALSAAIAGIQEAIGGMDAGDATKLDDGYAKVNAAMLNAAKAESAMGTVLK